MNILRQTFTDTVVLDASGNGSVIFVARGDVYVFHTTVRVAPAPGQQTTTLVPIALMTVNGKLLEGSETGNLDTSDTKHLMLAQDELVCTWEGGDPGATATLAMRAIQYPAGEGTEAVYGPQGNGGG